MRIKMIDANAYGRIGLFFAISIGLSAAFFPTAASAASLPTVTAQQWRAVEITFTGINKAYLTNPNWNGFLGVAMDVKFTGPNGEVINRPAFWDGGNIWRVRFAPTALGTWTYVSTASATADAGIHGVTGTILAVAYEANPYLGALPIYVHGFLKSTGRFLSYADGTPYFPLITDFSLMNGGFGNGKFDNGGSLEGTNSDVAKNWSPAIGHPEIQALSVLERARALGFTAVTYMPDSGNALWKADSKGHYDHLHVNLEKFQNFMDPVMKHTADLGLVNHMMPLYAHARLKPANGGVPSASRMMRYLVARYGAYPMMWSIGEADPMPQYDWIHEDFTKPNPDPAGTMQMLNYMFNLLASYDGYKHPLGPWLWSTTNRLIGAKRTKIIPIGLVTTFLNLPSVTYINAHCGSIVGNNQFVQSYEFYSNLYPNKPLIDAGGCNIEFNPSKHANSEYVTRRSAWRAMQSGSMGYGYQGQGLWNMLYERASLSGLHDATHYDDETAWYDGIDFPAFQEMGFIPRFYNTIPWQTLVPHNTKDPIATWIGTGCAVMGGVNPKEISCPLLTADSERKNVVVYVPAEFPWNAAPRALGTIGTLKAATYVGKWYNPSTGQFTLISEDIQPTAQSYQVPLPPVTGRDWVLLLTAK